MLFSLCCISLLRRSGTPGRAAAPGLGRLPRGCLSGPPWKSWKQRTTPTVFTVNSLADTVAVNLSTVRTPSASVAALGRDGRRLATGGAGIIVLPAGPYNRPRTDESTTAPAATCSS